jgi:hypothetical protein
MPIYADRAEKDSAGNTISSTYQPALPSKSGNAGKVLAVNSNADGLEWVNQSSGSTYTAGDGIDITGNEISVVPGAGLVEHEDIDQGQSTIAVSIDGTGGLIGGVDDQGQVTGASLALYQNGILKTAEGLDLWIYEDPNTNEGCALTQEYVSDGEPPHYALKLNVDGTTIGINANNELEALGIPTIGTTSL